MQTLLKTLVHVMRFQSLSFTIYGKTLKTFVNEPNHAAI